MNKRNYKHGLYHHKLYKVWATIKQRCYNPNYHRYQDWGGRGISMSDEWKTDPKKFIMDCIKIGWRDGLIIDRIDNNGNYTYNNVRFIDIKTSNNNRRNRSNPKSIRPDKKSKLPVGVYFDKKNKKNPYIAQIKINKKKFYLGSFPTVERASIAYQQARRNKHAN